MPATGLAELPSPPDPDEAVEPIAPAPPVAILMGSQSDWGTLRHASATLAELGVGHEARIVSAHRTPKRLYDFAGAARARGVRVVIAGAGGAAHLPGMVAALTPLPVFGVPVEAGSLGGLDALLSIVQMPAGVPVGTLAVGRAGAVNAALLACAVLALGDAELAQRLDAWREARAAAVAEVPLDGGEDTISFAEHLGEAMAEPPPAEVANDEPGPLPTPA